MRIPLFVFFVFFCISLVSAQDPFLCCGGDEVFLIDGAHSTEKLWSWRAEDWPEIPKEFRAKFSTTDDCKPYVDAAGAVLLITSSASGVALIQRHSKACLFLAESRNAHSACLLPRGQVAVAASTGGDAVQIFNRRIRGEELLAKPVQSFKLKGAHGTVWDATRRCLWALGTDELVQFDPGAPGKEITNKWSITARHPLPSVGGHDLSPFHNGKHLYVTTNTEVLSFNRDTPKWTRLEGFGTQLKVKSIDRHPITNEIVYHMGTKTTWWSDTIRFQDPERPPLRLPGERLYKIRWDAPAAVPHLDSEVAAYFRAKGATVFLNRAGRITEVNANRTAVTDEDLVHLAQCTSLTDLSLEETAVTEKGMAAIADLPRLEWLNLFKARVGDEGLAHIANLPRLSHLPIGGNGITDAGLKVLKGKKRLRYLGLRGNQISNVGLGAIAGLTGLRELHIGETAITKLGGLKNLKRLETLYANGLALEAGEEASFRAAHPGCRLVR